MEGTFFIATKDGGKIIKVPTIPIDNDIEYPSEWFLKEGNERPRLEYQGSSLGIKDINECILASRHMDLDEAILFLVTNIPILFSIKNPERWESYGRVIGKGDGEMINPLSLLSIHRDSEDLKLTEKGPEVTPKDIEKRMIHILALYRYSGAVEALGGYKTTVLDRMSRVMKEEPFKLEELDTGFLEERYTWESDARFKRIVAAVDMFLNRFPDHKYSKMKVLLLGSRYRDCGSFSALRDFARYLGTDKRTSWKYFYDSKIKEELIRITKEGEEISEKASYFPYLRDMGLSSKCPYSNTINPAIYNMVYTVGSLFMIKRALNARLFSDENIVGTTAIAMMIAYYRADSIDAEQFLFDGQGEYNDYKEKMRLLLEEGGDSGIVSPDDIFGQIVENKFTVPDKIRLFHKKRLTKLVDLRENTIGQYLTKSI